MDIHVADGTGDFCLGMLGIRQLLVVQLRLRLTDPHAVGILKAAEHITGVHRVAYLHVQGGDNGVDLGVHAGRAVGGDRGHIGLLQSQRVQRGDLRFNRDSGVQRRLGCLSAAARQQRRREQADQSGPPELKSVFAHGYKLLFRAAGDVGGGKIFSVANFISLR